MAKYQVSGNLLVEVTAVVEANDHNEALTAASDEVSVAEYGGMGSGWAAGGIEGDGADATCYGVEWQHAECIEDNDDAE